MLYIICPFVYISQVTHICLSVHVELSLSLILSVYLPNFITAFLSLYVYLRSFSLSLSLPSSFSYFFSISSSLLYVLPSFLFLSQTLFLRSSSSFLIKLLFFLHIPINFYQTSGFGLFLFKLRWCVDGMFQI